MFRRSRSSLRGFCVFNDELPYGAAYYEGEETIQVLEGIFLCSSDYSNDMVDERAHAPPLVSELVRFPGLPTPFNPSNC